MKSYAWTLSKDEIHLIASNSDKLGVTAKDIFSAEFKGSLVIHNQPIPSPSHTLENISFSKFPLDLVLTIEASAGNASSSPVVLRVYGCVNKIKVLITNPLIRSIDHIVDNSTWYPFLPGSLEAIKSLYAELNIPDSGEITIRQYLALLARRAGYPEIIDESAEAASASSIRAKSDQISIPGFTGNMYEYQSDGYQWLSMIAKQDLGCILADQMGLGKTIQIIALLAAERAADRKPNLVIAPATLLENWRREILKFAAGLQVLVHQGSKRTGFPDEFSQYDVVVTSYETVVRDMSMFTMLSWNILVLDEAQAIKNSDAKRTLSVKKLKKRVSIAVTGTPVENSLSDLWSLMDFALPDHLGTKEDFQRRFDDDEDSASKLEPLISPLILRRLVLDVAQDLPERIDIPQAIELEEQSVSQYEQIRADAQAEYGKAAGLVSLQKLRMFCTHPLLSDVTVSEDPRKSSLKYVRLLEILDEVFQVNEKAIIFTSYNEMIHLFRKDLPKHFGGIHIDYINGEVASDTRQDTVDRFAKFEGPGVLLLNPRAAGTGLNITAANHVIHFNPEWNPALEDQASARAYRRGQTKPVTVHRLFYADTVEEVMSERLDRKRALAGAAVVGVQGDDELGDIMKALRMSPIKT